MTKGISTKDQNLLKITGCFILLALVFNFFLKPVSAEQKELSAKLDTMEVQKIQMEALISNEDLKENMEEQKTKAMENYEFFYGVLNSYSVDGIINDLITEENLEITSLNINDYVAAAEERLIVQKEVKTETVEEDSETTPVETMLLTCKATVAFIGNYENVLSFIDKLGKKSDCIEITNFRLDKKTISGEKRYDEFGEEVINESLSYVASIDLNIYGIDNSSIEELQRLQENAKQSGDTNSSLSSLEMETLKKNEAIDNSEEDLEKEPDEELEEEFVEETPEDYYEDDYYYDEEVEEYYEEEPAPIEEEPADDGYYFDIS